MENTYEQEIIELKEELKKSKEATEKMRELNVILQKKLNELTKGKE